ncbi:uncharacterized protein BROUX77_001127 [Berkeleyomyces rouxiae]|uniref:uncharacterized protein n=1 Tax=Berkeleyomyces rouxiae TaxID=2035830 RepID=UPI003B820D50
MPLHLLNKKSWNVYNKDNVARVRRDEAEARTKKKAETRRREQAEAEQRLEILRREAPISPEAGDHHSSSSSSSSNSGGGNRDLRGGEEYARPTDSCSGPSASLGHGDRSRRARKHANEYDTDYELRLAKHNTGQGYGATTILHPEHPQHKHKQSSAPITDEAGHIDLFGGTQHSTASGQRQKSQQASTGQVGSNEQVQQESWRRIKLPHATGGEPTNSSGSSRRSGGGSNDAWYTSTRISATRSPTTTTFEAPTQDVWGNHDPRRPQREAARLMSNDPLMMMKQGARKTSTRTRTPPQAYTQSRPQVTGMTTTVMDMGHGLGQSPSHEKSLDLRMNDDKSPQKDQRPLLSSHRHSRSRARL